MILRAALRAAACHVCAWLRCNNGTALCRLNLPRCDLLALIRVAALGNAGALPSARQRVVPRTHSKRKKSTLLGAVGLITVSAP